MQEKIDIYEESSEALILTSISELRKLQEEATICSTADGSKINVLPTEILGEIVNVISRNTAV